LPLISIYSSFLVSRNKPKKVLVSLIIATVINVILNLVFILSLLKYGQIYPVYGAALATIISQVIYLFCLIIQKD
jgi:Na+-driven multidrug efflux pump